MNKAGNFFKGSEVILAYWRAELSCEAVFRPTKLS